jgi:hypothetical protein
MAEGTDDLINYSPHDIVVGNTINESVTKYMEDLRFGELKKMHKKALTVRYVMNARESNIFKDLMGTRHAVLADKPNTNPHAIPANLHCMAYEINTEYSKLFRTNLDCGGTALRTPLGHHIDVKIDNARDCARHHNANILRPENQFKYMYTQARESLCINGAENCRYQAEHGYMINVYDITLETIAQIMNNHNMNIFDAWLFLPYILSDKNNTTDQTYYTCHIVDEPAEIIETEDFIPLFSTKIRMPVKEPRKQVVFALNDSSNVYRHDYETWRSYLTTTIIRGAQGSAIVMEHVEAFGTFTHIRFTRTWCKAGIIERYYPMDIYMKDYLMQPSISSFIEDGFWICNNRKEKLVQDLDDKMCFRENTAYNPINGLIYKHFYVVERNFIESVRAYGNSLKKDAFTYESFAAYCNTKRTSIVYERNSKLVMVHKGLSASTNVYNLLVLDLFLQCAIDRYNRTQTISRSINKITAAKDFWSLVKSKLGQWWC